jgi:hypothetical protein
MSEYYETEKWAMQITLDKFIILCIYDYAKWFDNGVAEVTFKATEYLDSDEHRRVDRNPGSHREARM